MSEVVPSKNTAPPNDIYAYDLETNTYYRAPLPLGYPARSVRKDPFLYFQIFVRNIEPFTVKYIYEHDVPVINHLPPYNVVTPVKEAQGGLIRVLQTKLLPENSVWTKLIDYTLPADKNSNATPLTIYDGLLVSTTTLTTLAGIYGLPPVLTFLNPLGPILFVAASSALVVRRGFLALLGAPLLAYTAVRQPQLFAQAVKETATFTARVARETVETSFKVIGILVTVAGVVVGYVITRKT